MSEALIEAKIEEMKKHWCDLVDMVYKAAYNEGIEDAAVKLNEEMGTDETDTYYMEREIRKLKKE